MNQDFVGTEIFVFLLQVSKIYLVLHLFILRKKKLSL